ncbi:hypothetical protein [Kitasatospora phosalacinea]|uniref:PepSY domain-containing protein n=1 Tax=Kitasatospora phosalacinea TaxID=2065 RepID=A0ABW6GLE1_9ACTN
MDEQERPGRPVTAGRARPGWLRGRAVRWGGGVAVAALLVGGGAAAVASAGHHGQHGQHGGKTSARDGEHDGRRHGDGPRGGRHDRGGRAGPAEQRKQGQGQEQGPGQGQGPGRRQGGPAPAPLPSLAAADAVLKAAAAVPGGRVESLRTVAAADGGRAWQAVVLGPDGVRHLVTVDGTTGEPTGNTVLGG